MIGIKSNYLRDKIIKHSLGMAAFTMPASVYFCLYSTDPTDADTGTELSGGSYARQLMALTSPSTGIVKNSSAVAFTGLAAGTASYWAIRDASSGGNLIYHGALASPITIAGGGSVSFSIGNITLEEE